MTEDEFNELKRLKDTFELEALETACKYREIHGWKYLPTTSHIEISFDGKDIIIYYSDRDGDYNVEFPIEYLWTPSWIDVEKQKIAAEILEREIKQAQKRKEANIIRETNERELLKILKEKYEGSSIGVYKNVRT